jgi:enoyl-CoA hydratase/carnithine racemase
MARLARLVGRSRAAEIVLGADDFPASLAERYGYVNLVVADGELNDFVDRFARRLAGFDKTAIAGAKALLDLASLPADEEFGPGMTAFLQTAWRPVNAARMRYLLERGLQTPTGAELDLGRAVGEIGAPQNDVHHNGRTPG